MCVERFRSVSSQRANQRTARPGHAPIAVLCTVVGIKPALVSCSVLFPVARGTLRKKRVKSVVSLSLKGRLSPNRAFVPLHLRSSSCLCFALGCLWGCFVIVRRLNRAMRRKNVFFSFFEKSTFSSLRLSFSVASWVIAAYVQTPWCVMVVARC